MRSRMALAALVAGFLSFVSPAAHAAPTCASSDYTTSTHMGSGTYSQYPSGEQAGVMYTVDTFTNTSTNCLLVLPSSVTKVDVLVVGGGGGGGPRGGGGGGAGGYYFGTGFVVSGPETITVGSGGANVTTTSCPTDGGDSVFGNTKVDGGGGAGGSGCNGGAPLATNQPYGSGGGALYSKAVGVQLDSTYVSSNILGNVGGAGSGSQVPMGWAGGGGGGAKSFGESSTVTNSNGTGYAGVLTGSTDSSFTNYNGVGGKGGAGLFNLITGSKVCYAAGGGGGTSLSSASPAGAGGQCADGIDTITVGGAGGHGGASDFSAAVAIVAGSGITPGSGGGGAGFGNCTSANCSTTASATPSNYSDYSNGTSGSGASGIVVVRYITPTNYGVNPTLSTLHNSPTTISDTGTVSGFTRTWQWYRSNNGGSTYTAITGATSASYTFTPDLPSYNNNLFRMVITDTSPTGEISTVTSSPLTLTVLQNAASFSAFSLTGSATSAVYRTSIAITATVNTSGKVTFYSMGKPVPNCRNIATTGAGPITAVCNWKPSLHGVNSITAKLVPTDANYTAQTSTPFKVLTVPRPGTR